MPSRMDSVSLDEFLCARQARRRVVGPPGWPAKAARRAKLSLPLDHTIIAESRQGNANLSTVQLQINRSAGPYATTSRWAPGEVVRDAYLIVTPPGSRPCAVRVGMYRALADGTFANSPWLTIPLPGSASQGS